jgi:hypothetical protein
VRASTLRRALLGALSVAIGWSLLKAVRWELRKRDTPGRGQEIAEAMVALEEAQLRVRFSELAPEFRQTHAGAGRPRAASDGEIEALMSLGLVECVARPHVAAGMLNIYKLTPLGDAVDRRSTRGKGLIRRPSSISLFSGKEKVSRLARRGA